MGLRQATSVVKEYSLHVARGSVKGVNILKGEVEPFLFFSFLFFSSSRGAGAGALTRIFFSYKLAATYLHVNKAQTFFSFSTPTQHILNCTLLRRSCSPFMLRNYVNRYDYM